MGGSLAVAILVVAHNNPNAVESDRVESIFVGEVVADVDRQQGTRSVDASHESRPAWSLCPSRCRDAARPACARSSRVGHLAVRACVWPTRSRRYAPVRPRGSEPRRRSACVLPVLRESPPGSRLNRQPRAQEHPRRLLLLRFGDMCRPVRLAQSRGCPHTRYPVSAPGRGYRRGRGRSVWRWGIATPSFASALAAPSTRVAAFGSATMGDKVPS